tara:strand:+ start:8208 stop:12641 length:4434 start_codon:yes stop_codon:yes gene_type:complete
MLFVVFNFIALSQVRKFTPEPEKFLKELQSCIGEADKSKAKNFVKSFEPFWLGEFFTPDLKAHVYATSNLMGEKGMRVKPDYLSYFNSLLYFSKTGLDAKTFEDWHSTLDKVINKLSKKRISSFLQTSENLFKDNSIFTSGSTKGSTTWKTSNLDFEISYEKVPIFYFKNTDLKCFSKNDSSIIYETSGSLMPLTNMWLGEKGKIDWQRARLDKEKFYAKFNSYNISLKSASLIIDSVLFYSSYFPDAPVRGKLTEKVISNLGYKKVKYPNFESYDKRLLIKNVFPNVDYDGGFSIKGRSLFGAGSIDNLAKLTIKYQDEEFLLAESINFIINDEEIFAEQAKVKILIESDSIIHPAVGLNYSDKIKTLTLNKGDKGISAAPFFNSYHKLDMYPQSMTWKIGDPIIEFHPLKGTLDEEGALFASLNFFDSKVYQKLTGENGNPLIKIKKFSKEYGSITFPSVELANYMRESIVDLQFLLYELTEFGFINYDDERKTVTCSQKMFDYIDARSGKKDYDRIIIKSKAKVNATLSLTSLDLKLNGVDRVALSLAKKVWIKPLNNKLLVKNNRDFDFDGLITAGKTQYYGTGFSFKYDDFRINIAHCDSMFIWADYKESKKVGQLVRSPSIIESLSGFILIDGAENKSGRDTSMHAYPKLQSNVDTYVYYDNPSILNGIYSRDNFMFIIKPFTMDSLDKLPNESISLTGEFKSGGIFPDFNDSLSIQNDYSLGFIRSTPTDGFNIYGKTANYDNEIRLSGDGLKGSGIIDFFTSTALSDDVTFFPDSLAAFAHTYTNQKKETDPEIPLVKGINCKVTYVPNEDLFYANTIEDKFIFFDNEEADLAGGVILGLDGMYGNGTMRFGKGEVQSLEYTYETDAILADTSDFRLVSSEENLDALAFKTQNLNARVDFSTRIGEFKSNSGESFVTFPENEYICYMDKFNWFMDTDDLEMENSKQAVADINIDTDLDLATSNFYSINPDQDSINFGSSKARFDVRRKKIYCKNIEFIKIADSRIIPDSGDIVIRKKAKIEKLENSMILTNDVTKYYQIYNAEVEINTKHDYIASGTYDYIDINETIQPLFFKELRPDTTNQTFGTATIDEEMGFKLSPNYDFFGEVNLASTIKNLEFSGKFKMNHSCDYLPKQWVDFTSNIDPKEVMIPIHKDTTSSKNDPKRIYSGIIFNTTDSISLYASLLSSKQNNSHIDLINATGLLNYDANTEEYQLSNLDKLTEYKLPGKYVSLNTKTCRLKADGEFNFGIELDQVDVKSAGEIKFNPKKWETDVKSSVLVKFPINNQALEKMSMEILEFPDLRALDVSNSYYEKALRELVGIEQADKMVSDLTINGKVKKFPELLEVPLFFGDLRLRWNSKKNAFISYGNIGIANINKKQIMKYVKGKVVISKRLTGNDITIYLELDEKNYYYFNYKNGLMQVFSSNEEFNTEISETKKDDTKFKVKDMADYQFMLGTEKQYKSFKAAYMK